MLPMDFAKMISTAFYQLTLADHGFIQIKSELSLLKRPSWKSEDLQ